MIYGIDGLKVSITVPHLGRGQQVSLDLNSSRVDTLDTSSSLGATQTLAKSWAQALNTGSAAVEGNSIQVIQNKPTGTHSITIRSKESVITYVTGISVVLTMINAAKAELDTLTNP